MHHVHCVLLDQPPESCLSDFSLAPRAGGPGSGEHTASAPAGVCIHSGAVAGEEQGQDGGGGPSSQRSGVRGPRELGRWKETRKHKLVFLSPKPVE